MKLKIHPLFFVLALLVVMCGQAQVFVWTFIALVLHECAHALMARVRGFVVKELTLLPFGAMMHVDERLDRTSSLLIGLAGPLSNLLMALVILGLWWLYPDSYNYTQPFFMANVTLGLFNLLPVYPLDGSRIVLGFSKHKLKAIKVLQVLGVLMSFILLGLFVFSAFNHIQFSLGILAVFLFYGATFGAKQELFISVLESTSKSYHLGVARQEMEIGLDVPLVRFFHHTSSTTSTIFCIVDEYGNQVARLTEKQLQQLSINNKLSTRIGDVLKIKSSEVSNENNQVARLTEKQLQQLSINNKLSSSIGNVLKIKSSEVSNIDNN